jgi:hypothetical protein
MGFRFIFFVVHVDYNRGTHYLLLLFVVVMEVLSRMMSVVMDNGLLSGFFVGARNSEEMIV